MAAQSVLRIIGLFTYMVPMGIQSSANFLIGKFIGKNRVDLAKRIAKLIALVALIWSILSVIFVYSLRKNILSIFTGDNDIKSTMINAWGVITIFVFFDCIQGVANGAIIGLGTIARVKWVTVLDYWVIGIPISLYFMFNQDLGIKGLWIGPTVAVVLNFIFYSWEIFQADW